MGRTSISAGLRKVTPSGLLPKTLPEIMASYERIIIIQALQLNDCSRARTADSLGVSRRHLYRRMSILKIDLQAVTMGRSGHTKLLEEGEGDG
jgi:DNA-binding NtrC family response regulator